MNVNTAISNIVNTVGKVEGRKRLQKMIHLMIVAGYDVDASFRIHRYGPFSEEVASVADTMVIEGELEEYIEAAGPYGTFQYLYRSPRKGRVSQKIATLIKSLNEFSTVELEVASTIAFFESQGIAHEAAIQKTRFLKPKKTTTRVLQKAEDVLEVVKHRQ